MTFENPVIPGFYPDPSLCRVGDDYYLVASSFTYFPGVPIFRSNNLVSWTQIGNVLDRREQLELGGTEGWSSLGVYAPTIRYHDGRLWMITTVMGHPQRTFFVTTEHPEGPWSDPIQVSVPGIDPDIAWDQQGDCWVHFSGLGGIARCRIDDRTGLLLDDPQATWSGSGLQYPEAPHLFRRDGIWYLLVAEGGTERGHAVSVARSDSPLGPWEACADNPIVSHRSTDSPIQNVGHADLVEATDGTWWMSCLGVRPRGVTPGYHVLGRETFLTPVEWIDGWPVAAELKLDMDYSFPKSGDPVSSGTYDRFGNQPLHSRWIAVRRPLEEVSSLSSRPDWLTLQGTDATMDSPEPAFVGRRQQHHHCRLSSLVDPGTSSEAGVAIRMDEDSHYEIGVAGSKVLARARIGPLVQVVAEGDRPNGHVELSIEVVPGGNGPDRIRLGIKGPGGGLDVLADLDGRYLSTEVCGGFIGRHDGDVCRRRRWPFRLGQVRGASPGRHGRPVIDGGTSTG